MAGIFTPTRRSATRPGAHGPDDPRARPRPGRPRDVTSLPAACFVTAWHFGAQQRSRAWVIYSIAVAVMIVVFFILGIVASDMG